MDLAGAERLARRLHRSEIDEAGRSYVDHLERVAGLVASGGGDDCEQMAAWLHGAAQADVTYPELAAWRVPRRVVRIVRALTPSPAWEAADSRADRIRACRGAVRVLRADVWDLCRPEALSELPANAGRLRHDRCRELLTSLDEPMPPGLTKPPPRRQQLDVTALLSKLQADDPDRWTAVQALGSAGELRAAQPLIDAYLAAEAGDPRWAGQKHQLTGALSSFAFRRRHQDDQQWVQLLVRLSAHPDPFLRATAIRGLAGLSEHEPIVTRALSDASPLVAEAALLVLTDRQVREHTDALAAIAAHGEPQWAYPRRFAVRQLAKAGCADCNLLLAAVAIDGMSVGHRVVTTLTRDCGPQAIPQLLAMLRPGTHGRAAVVCALGELRARAAAEPLAAVLREEGADIRVVLACIEALTKIADPVAAPAIATATRHHLAGVRVSALIALSRIGHPDLTQIALAASDDFDPGVRDRAVRLLAARGDQRATARLLLFCDGPLAPVVLKGLIRIADERAEPALRRIFLTTSDRQTRHLAGRALARSASNAAWLYPGPWLTRPQLRAMAWVLGEIGDPKSAWKLSRLLIHRDELVRTRAATALGKIAGPATAPALHTALNDISPRVRAAAATALGQLSVSEATHWLRPRLNDPNPAVRAATEAALRRLHADHDEPG